MDLLNTYHIYKHAWVYSGSADSEQQLLQNEVNSLLQNGGWMVRNAYDFDCGQPTDFWFVIKEQYEDIEGLSKNTRSKIRRGISRYIVRQVSEEELLSKGYNVLFEATKSYKVKCNTPSFDEFKKRIQESTTLEFWAAFNSSNEMVAFSINKIVNNTCDYQTLKAIPADMKNYVYYALIHTMNQHYLQKMNFLYVNDGARSITEHSNIQPFLEDTFNFRKAFCHLKIYYKWWFGIIVKCLYPFRGIIKNNQIHAVLAMHGMQS